MGGILGYIYEISVKGKVFQQENLVNELVKAVITFQVWSR